MKRYETLGEIVEFILRRHRCIKKIGAGATAYKFLRRRDGRRILFEISKGFKIFEFGVHDENTLVINQLAAGYAFKGKKKHVFSSSLYLQDLVVVNVYDHKADFFSWDSIDFSYIENDFAVDIQMLQEWINNETGIIRAQWIGKDKDVEKILDEIGCGSKIIITPDKKRLIDMND